MEFGRPDPDELLEHVQAETRQSSRGRLKIFLGYAAGVGKTYTMLQAAHQRKTEGIDVVAAYVETHHRAETDRLVDGLEVLPRREIDYRGTLLTELNLDAVLARAPQLALVDEFAHTNAPDSRHPKRFQDVEELLDAGIDVYTTLNVQHIESYNDVVAQITTVVVKETVPDSVVDQAAEIELVDLPPEELLQRLREGKVYVPAKAARAVELFFRQGNLTALREIALRRAAQQVDAQMLAYMTTRGISGPWPAAERLLVAVGPSPLSERLVRTAKRLADELRGEWLALYIETPATAHDPAARDRAAANLALAERLGAKIFTLPGSSVAETLVDYAHRHNVTKIIAGKPTIPRWREVFRGSMMDRIIRLSGDIDVYVINSESTDSHHRVARTASPPGDRRRWLYALPPVVVATLIGWPLRSLIEPANLVMLYLAAVVLTAVFLGRGPAILTALLGVLAFDFFLVPPYLTFAVTDAQYFLTFAGLFVVGLVMGTFAARSREQARAARSREQQTGDLYELSRELASAPTVDDVVTAAADHVRSSWGEAVILLAEDDELAVRMTAPAFDDNEIAVATWAYLRRQPAGRGTDTLPAAAFHYLPLTGPHEVYGVMGVEVPEPRTNLTPGDRLVLQAYATLTGLALERVKLTDEASQVQILRAADEFQTALLNSISHELRTPLASITGVLSGLKGRYQNGASRLDPRAEDELVQTAWEEAERLNQLVGNLLDMSRLQAGALCVNLEPVDVEDLVGATLNRFGERLTGREVSVDVQPDLPPVSIDFVLIVHALSNLLDNALKYSPSKSPLEVAAAQVGAEVWISVADHGRGIPTADLEAVFDKFYRVDHNDPAGGIGLGLPISRGILQAHDGRVWAENRVSGGTVTTIALPITPPVLSPAGAGETNSPSPVQERP